MTDFTAAWHWPQWTFLILMTLQLIGHAVKHGQSREPHNFPAGLIGYAITIFILICGGFFA
jgi:hypothetical protein